MDATPVSANGKTPDVAASDDDCVMCAGVAEWTLAVFGLFLAGVLIYMSVDVLTGSKVSSMLTGKVIQGELAE